MHLTLFHLSATLVKLYKVVTHWDRNSNNRVNAVEIVPRSPTTEGPAFVIVRHPVPVYSKSYN